MYGSQCAKGFLQDAWMRQGEVVMLAQDVGDLAAHFKRIRTDAEVLRKRNKELAGVVDENVVHATVESARSKAVKEKVASIKPKLSRRRVESASSRWSTHNVGKRSSRVEADVNKALMAMSGLATDATKWKVAIIESKIKDVL